MLTAIMSQSCFDCDKTVTVDSRSTEGIQSRSLDVSALSNRPDSHSILYICAQQVET